MNTFIEYTKTIIHSHSFKKSKISDVLIFNTANIAGMFTQQ